MKRNHRPATTTAKITSNCMDFILGHALFFCISFSVILGIFWCLGAMGLPNMRFSINMCLLPFVYAKQIWLTNIVILLLQLWFVCCCWWWWWSSRANYRHLHEWNWHWSCVWLIYCRTTLCLYSASHIYESFSFSICLTNMSSVLVAWAPPAAIYHIVCKVGVNRTQNRPFVISFSRNYPSAGLFRYYFRDSYVARPIAKCSKA